MDKKRPKPQLRAYIPLLIFFASLYYIPKIEAAIGTDKIQDFLSTAGFWAPIGFVTLRIITIVISPLLLGPLATLANRAFGFWPAIGLNIIAELIGASINYWLGRVFGDGMLKFFFGRDIAQMVERYSHNFLSKNTYATALLMYGYNYEIVAYACGIARVPFRQFFIALSCAAFVSVPIMVWQDVSIGNNNWLAIALQATSFASAMIAIWLVASGDIKRGYKKLKDEIKQTHDENSKV